MRKRHATYPDVIEIWGITAPEDEMLATAVHYERIIRRGSRCVMVDFGLTLNRFGWEEDDITITGPEKEDADA